MDMIEKYYKITLKTKHVISTATLTKSKLLLYIGYEKLHKKTKNKYKSLDLEKRSVSNGP